MRLEDEFLKALNKVARFDTNSRGKQIKTMVFYDASNRKLFVAQAHPKQ
jgi:hypothetical protein